MKKNIKTIFGIFLLILGITVLFINENENIKDYNFQKQLDEITVVNNRVTNKNNNGKRIFLSGKIDNQSDYLTDENNRIQVDALKLIRKVEVYQWSENNDKSGKSTYQKIWDEGILDSSSFSEASTHQNPTDVSVNSTEIIAPSVYVGSYALSEDFIKKLKPNHEITEYPENIILNDDFHIEGKYITNSKNLKSAEIGDIRISYTYFDLDSISILATQGDNNYIVPDDDMRVEGKIYSFADFKSLYIKNTYNTFIRVIAFILEGISFCLLLDLLTKFKKVDKFFSKIGNKSASTFCLSLGGILSIFVIAIMWLFTSFKIFIALFIISIVMLLLILFMAKKTI